MSTKRGVSNRSAYVGVEIDGDHRWRWTVISDAGNGNQQAVLARSVATFPSESQARGEGWASYQALRRGEGDRKKWGSFK